MSVKANVNGDKTWKFAVSNWAEYTNTKAKLSNAGKEGYIFAGVYRDFESEDIMKMMGVYMIDGLAPSPRLIHKMQPWSKQWMNGNDFIAECMGSQYKQTYYSVRHFFGCQDPFLIPPTKEKCPSVKVDEFFHWYRHVWKVAWVLGQKVSIDKQMCKMQGRSEYKTRCGKYKRLGGGIQADCIADDGFIYDFYFHNEPPDMM